MAAAIIPAAASVVGGFISSQGAKKAANTQADAIDKASQISKERADEARATAVKLVAPALETFLNGMKASANEVASGRLNTIDVLKSSTANADELLRQGAQDAQQFLSQNRSSRQPSAFSPQSTFEPARRDASAAQDVQDLIKKGEAGFSVVTPEKDVAEGTIAGGGAGALATAAAAPTAPTTPTSGRSRAELSGWARNVLGDRFSNFMNLGSNEWKKLIKANPDIAMEASKAFNATRHDAIRNQLSNQGLLPPGYTTTTSSGTASDTAAAAGTAAGPSELEKTFEGIATARDFKTTPRESVRLPRPQAQQYNFDTGATPNEIIERGLAELAGAEGRGLGAIDRGTMQAIAELRRGEEGGLSNIASGTGAALGELERGRGDVTAYGNLGLEELSKYADTGEAALSQQAAITGALGPEEQQKALQAFSESPGQKYLREKQEQTLLRNAAAIGGLRGGNVRTALQEQAMGIASTDLQRHVSNLAQISGLGGGAASQQANIQAQTGGRLGSIASQGAGVQQTGGLAAADLLRQLSLAGGGFEQQGGLAQGALIADIAGKKAGLSGTQAGIEGTLMQQRALLAANAAKNRAALQQDVGTNIANVEQATTTNIANLLAQAGSGASDIQTNLATLLANIATGQGSEQAGLVAAAGGARAAGQMGGANAFSSALENLGKIDYKDLLKK